jgi:predicted nucleic acid-binding protein
MKPTIMSKIALDTNILIYNHLEDESKWNITNKLLSLRPVISTQVISEYLNVMKRSFRMEKVDLMDLCALWMKKCVIHPVDVATVEVARRLIKRYDFQIFDSIIIAAAIEAGCEVLYSEDMQHNMMVEKQLRIINPFKDTLN